MSKDTGGAAFPGISIEYPNGIDPRNTNNPGMTLRDYFAAKYLEGVMATYESVPIYNADAIAQDAYKMADVMLKERAK